MKVIMPHSERLEIEVGTTAASAARISTSSMFQPQNGAGKKDQDQECRRQYLFR